MNGLDRSKAIGTVKTVPYKDRDSHQSVGNGLDHSETIDTGRDTHKSVVNGLDRSKAIGTVKTVPYEDSDTHQPVVNGLDRSPLTL